MADDSDDKTEDPTQKRLDDALAKGDVAKSQEVNTWFIIAGATLILSTFSGSIGYHGQVTIPWSFVAVFTALAIAGILIGTHLVRFVSQAALKQGFAGFLVVLGALILIRNQS